ncbi:MAG: Uma2 family endonuclease [Dolichospermum sp.]
MTLTINNLEQIEQILKDDNNDYQIELQEGNILIMGPSDIESSEIGAELIRLLGNWIYGVDGPADRGEPAGDLARPDAQRHHPPVSVSGRMG